MTFICYEVITSSTFPPSLPKKATTTGEHECGTRQHMPAQYDQGHMLNFDPTKQETRAIVAADKAILSFIQDGHVTNSEYFESNALVEKVLS